MQQRLVVQVSALRPFYELGRWKPLQKLPSLAQLRSSQQQLHLPETLVADYGADTQLQSFLVRSLSLPDGQRARA